MNENEMNPDEGFSVGFLEDQELLARHRAGDPNAYGELFAKHRRRAFGFAKQYSRSNEQSEDLVIEAFTRILGTIRRGKGPTISMGHYLASTIRTLAVSRSREDKHEFALDPQDVAEMYEREQFSLQKDPAMPLHTAGWLADAFNSLSTREQEVLWFRAVENIASKDIATKMGISTATATRVYQAATLELRKRFVALSIDASPTPECEEFRPQLMGLADENRPRRQDMPDGALKDHVEGCPYCQTLVSRLGATNRVLLSLVFLAGLGALAADALRTAPPASAEPLASKFAKPLLVMMIALPLVAIGVGVVGYLSSSQANEIGAEFTLGDEISGSASTLLRVGSCELNRVTLDGGELWRLSLTSPQCNAQVEYLGDGTGESTLLDTTATPRLRAAEIINAGDYRVTVSEGNLSERLLVSMVR